MCGGGAFYTTSTGKDSGRFDGYRDVGLGLATVSEILRIYGGRCSAGFERATKRAEGYESE